MYQDKVAILNACLIIKRDMDICQVLLTIIAIMSAIIYYVNYAMINEHDSIFKWTW